MLLLIYILLLFSLAVWLFVVFLSDTEHHQIMDYCDEAKLLPVQGGKIYELKSSLSK